MSPAGSCVFCKIAAGEIPATVVKRADGMLAFKDLSPQAPTHLLVIPTTHVSSLNDAKDAASLGKLLCVALLLTPAVGFAADSVPGGDPGDGARRLGGRAPRAHGQSVL